MENRLGTGVATHLAQNKNYAGVILETPFTSMIEAAKKHSILTSQLICYLKINLKILKKLRI